MKDYNYYVYTHNRLSDGLCFYVGIGKGKRVYDISKRNKFHNAVVESEQGFSWNILVNNVTKKKALELEQSFMKQIGIENLTNIMGAGVGNTGSFTKGQTPWNKGISGEGYTFQQVEVFGKVYASVGDACRDLGIGTTTFYRWKRKGKGNITNIGLKGRKKI